MPQVPHLLVVDDDRAMRAMLASLFKERGFDVSEASSADAALESASAQEPDVVVSDIRMPGRDGIELVGELRRLRPETPVVLMTAFGTIDSAVTAMRAGAFDYLTKPFEPEAVAFAVDRALEHRALSEENALLRRAVDQTSALGDLIGESGAMRDLFALIRRVAHGRSSVLITGESGTGKEVVARTIHYHGARAEQPFVPINCTAIPEGLLESELFGHVKGAFTGAHASKRGLFEKANTGTLFLDEIGDMGLALQGKLLRVLQDREIRPVGGNTALAIDVRIIAATNRDLEVEMAEGRFREDLFYRLNVIPIHVPPLRERPEDIPPLVRAFARRHAEGEIRAFSDAAVRRLQACPWRGNGRELENAVERALALSDADPIEVADLHLGTADSQENGGGLGLSLAGAAELGLTIDELTDHYIDLVLERVGDNKVQAARLLGIDRKTLYRRAERRTRNGARGPGEDG
jgi:two-component system response regulator AtoC